jgi:methylglyoxal/glyoxal reductase
MNAQTAQPSSAEHVELHSIADRVPIATGVMMPRLGVGTSHVVGSHDIEREITTALALGYRLIDTATAYGNEGEIGSVLAHTDVPREELFVTSKVWPADQGYEHTLRAFETSRSRLGLDYLDLYLIHWPEAALMAETWRAFELLLDRGEVRAIGVSNFMREDFKRLFAIANVPPAVDQIEFHPFLQRPWLVEYCRSRDVALEAWSPLMRGKITAIPKLAEIGARHDKTAAQVTLRWILQQGIVTIPKSIHEDRLRQNADIFDFELSAGEMAEIEALDRGVRR